MKNKILIYLLIFVSIILLFQIVNSGRILEREEELLDQKVNSIIILEAQKTLLKNRLDEESYFSLFGNKKSLNALGEKYNDSIVSIIKNALYEINISDKKSLIPYQNLGGVFLINQVKVLNHKWIIAKFSDGSLWGELLIEYIIDEKEIIFKTIEHLIYPIER
mgnify:CR=1 FL=1|jgi:hypothetical protein|tara:strand:- start:1774 stop:2262 length:489 start_codon:yes stop_codon:yes gene_type:complete